MTTSRLVLFAIVVLILGIGAGLLIAAGSLARQEKPSAAAAPPVEQHLKNIVQLTHGGQNAEAYFSPDGKRIIFQSTRDGLQCDQIFTMNVDGSDVRMVSTGKGRTTCAYFMPGGKGFIYASTHAAGDACPAPPDRSRGYVWPVYSTFDLYLADLDGRIVRRLTNEAGYDAEATVNWKTGRIIWTAMRNTDLDLYSMEADGKKVKRLTTRLGYDGGAFFSHDGKKIVWRAHYPAEPAAKDDYITKLSKELVTPMKMELFLADAGGGNARQLTSFGCASFAPFFTPDDRKVIFASNKNRCDSRYFELFLINTDGTGLEPVTDSGGFNSFPVFSPDGKKLMFVSNRGAKERYEFNIFLADWQP